MRFQVFTRLKAHLCGILNLGRCVNVCFTDCFTKTRRAGLNIILWSLGSSGLSLTLSVVLWNLCLV